MLIDEQVGFRTSMNASGRILKNWHYIEDGFQCKPFVLFLLTPAAYDASDKRGNHRKVPVTLDRQIMSIIVAILPKRLFTPG